MIQMLCAENADKYMELLIDFTMHKGIAKQLEAFRGKLLFFLIVFVLR